MKAYQAECDERRVKLFRQMVDTIEEATEQVLVDPSSRQKVARSENIEVILEQIEMFSLKWVKPANKRSEAETIYNQFWPRIVEIGEECERKTRSYETRRRVALRRAGDG